MTNQPALLIWPMVLGVTLFAWTLRTGDVPFIIGGALITFASLWHIRTFPIPRSVYWPFCVFAMLVTVSTLSTVPFEQWDKGLDWLSLALAAPLAVVFRQFGPRLSWVMLLPAAATLARIASHADPSAPRLYGYGIHWVPFGLNCAFSILCVLSVSPRLLASQSARWRQVAVSFALTAALVILLAALVDSGARSGLIALLVGLTVLMWGSRAFVMQPRFAATRLIVVVLAVAAVAVLLSSGTTIKRLQSGVADVSKLVSADGIDLSVFPREKDHSVGRRAHLIAFGIEKFEQQPWFGHGADGVKPLLDADPDFHIHPHLHNLYVQTLVELGLPAGLLLLVALCACMLNTRHGSPEFHTERWLGLAGLTSVLVWNLFSAKIHDADWRAIVIWLIALCLLSGQRGPSEKHASG